jgi:alkyl sulfatase BDS1-like metallo-beta-lactamase superfamily hydrolase
MDERTRWQTAKAVLAALVLACGPDSDRHPMESDADADGHRAATADTIARHAAARAALDREADAQDFTDARRGLIASDPEIQIDDATGRRIWDTAAYGFVAGDAPVSVHPGLWRQAQLNGLHGLFEVADGIYQVRGYDLANLTLIRGKTGWIAVDPLTARETAAAALALARRHLGDDPIVAIIFTHSHIDHFGGVEALLPDDPAQRAAVRIIAPRGFLEEATSENVLAGLAMGRRSSFMYGMRLARSERGHVDTGLGKEPARGTVGIVAPTEWIDRTPQDLVLDGVRFVFQYAPESEAPAELTFYLPDARAFCGAELVSHTLHNLYTLRGAKVRDALRWSGYIDEAIQLFGDADVVFSSHHWPVWENERVLAHLKQQRDTYKYIHDQTLRMANAGHTPREIAEQLELPASLRHGFANRDYYGTVRHNAKAVYQWYFGWYDANPAQLDPLPPEQAAVRYVAAMGGADAVLTQARESFERGEYRWTATLLDHLVFAEPELPEARRLLAQTYDQLGYRAEAGPWRDVYLSGAYELRHGPPEESPVRLATALDLLRATPMERFFDAMAARLIGPKADGKRVTLNFVFTDLGETHVLELENAVLHHRRRAADPDADATLRLTREFLLRLVTGEAGLREMIFSDQLDVDGSRLALLSFFSLLERSDGRFPIVTP